VPTLLLAFDGSASSRAAVARAGEVFPGAEAVVATVARGLVEFEDAASTARLALSDGVIRSAVSKLREATLDETREIAEAGAALASAAGLRARAEVVPTDEPVWAALNDAARDAGADLVVCGTHGHGMVARAIVGSVSTALVRKAELPVAVVPDCEASARGPILIAYDGSDAAGRAIEATGRLLGGRPAIVVHVWRSRIRHSLAGNVLERVPMHEVRDTVTDLDGLFEQWAQETAEQGADLARSQGLDARSLAMETKRPLAHAILQVADDEDAAAVVVGRTGGGFAEAVLGSVSEALLHALERPVLVA
jgi:nucleotide-binding universal stress UspA family protein